MRSRIVAALAAPALLVLAFITVAFIRGAAVRRGVAVAVRAAAVGSPLPAERTEPIRADTIPTRPATRNCRGSEPGSLKGTRQSYLCVEPASRYFHVGLPAANGGCEPWRSRQAECPPSTSDLSLVLDTDQRPPHMKRS